MLTRRRFLPAAGLAAAAFAIAPRTFAASTLASGTFTGASGHVTTGTASIERDGDAYAVRLGADFTFDGAPDPKVALGADGYDKTTILGALGKDSGEQLYPIPARIDASAYNEVWIWCERFNVPLGVAKLA